MIEEISLECVSCILESTSQTVPRYKSRILEKLPIENC